MIGEMSRKSKIYHRSGCRYINRIAEESLEIFDMNDGRIKKLKPCKCCCNIKSLYKRNQAEIDASFLETGIELSLEEDAVKVHTNWYDWKITLKKSSQNVKLYKEIWNEELQTKSLRKCTDIRESRNINTAIQYIINEEKIAIYHEKYRTQALQIIGYAEENGIQVEFEGKDIYILTDMAAWKITYVYRYDWYKLLHCPYEKEPLAMEQAKEAHYHVQRDVPRKQTPYAHLQYIVKHDIAKKIEEVDYKKLPQKTKRQKKYYKQAEKRAVRKSIGKVLDLLEELEARGAS